MSKIWEKIWTPTYCKIFLLPLTSCESQSGPEYQTEREISSHCDKNFTYNVGDNYKWIPLLLAISYPSKNLCCAKSISHHFPNIANVMYCTVQFIILQLLLSFYYKCNFQTTPSPCFDIFFRGIHFFATSDLWLHTDI